MSDEEFDAAMTLLLDRTEALYRELEQVLNLLDDLYPEPVYPIPYIDLGDVA